MFGTRPRDGLVFSLALVLSSSACSKSDTTSPTRTPAEQLSVLIASRNDTVALGSSKLLQARVVNQQGAPRSGVVAWESLHPTIATISNNVLAAVSPGTTQIVARIGSSADTALVTVIASSLEVRLTPSAVSAALGDTLHFSAGVYNAGNRVAGAEVSWQVSDTTAANVVGNGLLSTQTVSDVQVTARFSSAYATAAVRVVQSTVASVTISPSTSNLTVGGSATLRATVRSESGRSLQKEPVTWSSSDPAIVSVDGEGRLTALAKGGVIITATADGHSGTATVNVSGSPAASVVLSLPQDSLSVGATMQVSATAFDAQGQPLTGRTMAWQSSNPAVATITSKGVITSLIAGSTNISVICDGLISTQKLTVVVPTATSVVVSPGTSTMVVGGSAQLGATVRDQFGQTVTGQTVQWASSSSSTATVSSSGVVTAKGLGAATITATVGQVSGTASVTVQSVVVAAVSVSPSPATVKTSQSIAETATAKDAAGNVVSGRVPTWSTSNAAVATVQDGVVTGVSTGTATVTATIDGKSASVPVTVTTGMTSAIASVTLTLSSSTLTVGQSTQAVAHAYDAQGGEIGDAIFTWATANSNIATVTKGLVTATGAGSVVISVTAGGIKALAALTVTAPAPAPVATVTLSTINTSIFVGDSAQIVVVLKDANGNVLSGRSIGYSSSNSALLAISPSGVVHALGAGAATITATSEQQSGSLGFSISAVSSAPVATVVTTLGSSSLTAGQSTQASAVLRDASGDLLSGRAVSWASSNSATATVSSTGVVTAVAAGTADITATSEGISGGAALTVTNPVVAVVQVSLTATTLLTGQSAQATAVAKTATGQVVSGKSVTWTVSSGTNVVSLAATTSAATTVTGTNAGTAVITPVIDGVAGNATVSVTSTVPINPTPVVLPTLPATFNVSYPSVTGRQWQVRSGDNLQTALNNAQRGDEVVLQAGAVFTGNYVLPVKTGTAADGWVIVRSEQLSQMPAGGRVTPAAASLMPKIRTNNSMRAIATQPRASGWYLAGLEVTVDPALTVQQYGIVELGTSGSQQATLADVPTDIVLDRMYVHGQTTTQTSRCVALNSARTAIINSYLHECHGKGFDAQAINGYNGPGPFKIVNNTLAGSGENIMFGGADPSIPNLVPSDIEIRGNYIYTPISWKGIWTKKNLFELKNAQRVLLDGNVLDGSWADGQVGTAFELKSSNQSGTCGWCISIDLTFRNNIVRNVGQVFNIAARGNTNPIGGPLGRVLIENMSVDNVNVGSYLGDGRFILLLGGIHDITIRRNTMTTTGTSATFTTIGSLGAVTNLAMDANVFTRNNYGLIGEGSSGGVGTAALNNVYGTKIFTNNIIIGSSNAPYPSTTTWVSSLSAVVSLGSVGASTSSLSSSLSSVIIP